MADITSPQSLDEAFLLRDEIISEIEEIQRQLGNPFVSAKTDGTREEYFNWRNRTLARLNYRNNDLRQVKRWIRANTEVPA